MQISPIRSNLFIKNINTASASSVSFGSFCADANAATEALYADYTLRHRGYSIMKGSSTRIFRELSSELAIARLLDPNQKNEIKILGCSDGSEAWAHAIAIKEEMGEDISNTKIQAIDIAPHMIEIAKTGCIVLSDIEKKYAQTTLSSNEESPIAGDGWDKYLTKTTRPISFNDALKKYPYLKYYENDPVVKKSIGKGLDWYKINTHGLPDTTFECGDIKDYFVPDKDSETVVYVLSNTAVYFLGKGGDAFLEIFRRIKNESRGKNVYVVIGGTEDKYLNMRGVYMPSSLQRTIKYEINNLGFKNIGQDKLNEVGIQSEYTARRIYKLKND